MNIRRIISLLLCFITLFCFLAFPGAAQDAEDISTSDVMSDLKVMTIGGSKFSEIFYPKNPALTHVQVLSFLEYGYDYSGDQSDYGIYVYVYNPSCKNIKESNYNKIQIGAVKDENVTPIYRKYQLDEISRSPDNRFIKYRLRDVKIPNSTNCLYDIVDSSRRIYKVSGIELLTDGQYQPTDYAISGTYVYTGYGKGYRQDKNAESTLYCKVEELLTIRLDLKSTVWRTATSSLGIGHQNEVASVYFSIDDQILNTYGNLYAITAEWYEYKVESFVTDNKDFVDQYDSYIGQDVASLPGYDSEKGFSDSFKSFMSDYEVSSSEIVYTSADVAFNVGHSSDFHVDTWVDSVPYVYYVKSISDDYGELDVSPSEVLSNINLKGLFPLKAVDTGRVMGYNRYHAVLGDTFSFLNDSYKSNHSWWDYVLENGLWGWSAIPEEAYDDIEPIVKVTADDLRGSDSTVSQHLLVHESDVDSFASYYNAQTSLNKSVFLFRFAATDYYQSFGDFYDTDGGKTYQPINKCDTDSTVYYAKQTIYKDFDVIDLTFKDDYGALTVIPVVSGPTTIVGGLGGAPDPSDKVTAAVDTSFKVIFGILLGLALLLGVLWLVNYFFKLMNNGVSLYSKIKSTSSKPKRRKRSKK